jgi:hypothetical protein
LRGCDEATHKHRLGLQRTGLEVCERLLKS